MRRMVLGAGLAAALIGVGMTVAGHASRPLTFTFHKTKTTKYAISAPVTRVVARVDAGGVDVRPGTSTSVTVTESWVYHEPTVTVDASHGVLSVTVDCPDNEPFNNCDADVAITVPTRTGADLQTGAGNVTVHGLIGDERLRSSAGEVKATGINGDHIDAQSSAGNVSIADGHIPQTLSAQSDAGDVNVTVPAGRYALTASSDAGNVSVSGVVDDPGSARHLVAATHSGDVSVTGR